MRILITTQKVDKNDQVLGFFHRWIQEFSVNFEKVTVICLEEGEHDLPENVKVLSLGKNKGLSRFKYVQNFYKYIYSERKKYDVVFVHMNQIYVLLAGIVWRIMSKKVGLWYAHGHVPFSLRVATLFSDFIFTSTNSGYRVKSKKKIIVGQGIDTEKFKSDNRIIEKLKILTVGRVSKVKNLLLMVAVMSELKKRSVDFEFEIVGSAITEADKKYEQELRSYVKSEFLEDKIRFTGTITQDKLPEVYNRNNVFLNLSDTGSMDKVILEAMSCELKIVTSNQAFSDLIETVGLNKGEIADHIISGGIQNMRAFVKENHSIEGLIKKIKNKYESF